MKSAKIVWVKASENKAERLETARMVLGIKTGKMALVSFKGTQDLARKLNLVQDASEVLDVPLRFYFARNGRLGIRKFQGAGAASIQPISETPALGNGTQAN